MPLTTFLFILPERLAWLAGGMNPIQHFARQIERSHQFKTVTLCSAHLFKYVTGADKTEQFVRENMVGQASSHFPLTVQQKARELAPENLSFREVAHFALQVCSVQAQFTDRFQG